jgi:hypothetical protein
MVKWQRPVLATALLDSPEMALRLEGETEVDRRGADEGEGTGFDNLNLMAYAERVFVPPAGWEEARAFYSRELIALGWRKVSEQGHLPAFVQATVAVFERDVDERLQIQLLPMEEFWAGHHGRPGPFVRVGFSVAHH